MSLKLDLDLEGKSRASIQVVVLFDPERGRSFVGEGGSTESVIVREGSSGFSGDRGSPAKVVDRARYKKVVRRREPQTDSLPFCAINRYFIDA